MKNIRVIAPSRTLSIVSDVNRLIATAELQKAGFEISFERNVLNGGSLLTAPISDRIVDLHNAFLDKEVDIILTAIGGYNANQLLKYINYDLIGENHKPLCGYSDITVLHNAMYSKTGKPFLNGPHYSSWAMEKGFEYTKEYFLKAINEKSWEIKASDDWSDDPWYMDQENRTMHPSLGFTVLQEGEASGTLIGGHMRCLASLQGTQYWPGLENSILLLEEDEEISPRVFDRILQSFIHQKDFGGVNGILLGRFQKASQMTPELLFEIISSKKELQNIPIITDIPCGHTTPIATFPIGGVATLKAFSNKPKIIVGYR